MQNILLAVFCLIGIAVGWIIRKLWFEKGFVPATDLENIKNQLQDLKTSKAIADQTISRLQSDYNAAIERESACIEDNSKLKTSFVEISSLKKAQDETMRELRQDLAEKNNRIAQLQDELNESNKTIYQLKSDNQAKQEKLDTQKTDMENLGKKFEDTFKVLAQKILEDKARRFSEEQEKNLKTLLDPLKSDIERFNEDIKARHRQESEERVSLREQVKHMASLNQTLSDQANKLAETLRLQVKQQGDWGESILESILEHSGLQKDLQYKTQYGSRNDEGKAIRPDVVVNYPDGRKVVIDSKVSLNSYYNMCNAQNEEEEKLHLKELIRSIKNHIDGLASKNYGDISKELDFILMFVPVEPAYIAAMHGDPDLWQYAYKKGILLISPANLIATLKLVKDMWRKDAVDKNAQLIAEKAGKLYDKLVGFVETFEKVGSHLDKAKESWSGAFNQLKEGRGNVLSWGAQLKKLNIQSKKELPDSLTSAALLNDDYSVAEEAQGDGEVYENS